MNIHNVVATRTSATVRSSAKTRQAATGPETDHDPDFPKGSSPCALAAKTGWEADIASRSGFLRDWVANFENREQVQHSLFRVGSMVHGVRRITYLAQSLCFNCHASSDLLRRWSLVGWYRVCSSGWNRAALWQGKALKSDVRKSSLAEGLLPRIWPPQADGRQTAHFLKFRGRGRAQAEAHRGSPALGLTFGGTLFMVLLPAHLRDIFPGGGGC